MCQTQHPIILVHTDIQKDKCFNNFQKQTKGITKEKKSDTFTKTSTEVIQLVSVDTCLAYVDKQKWRGNVPIIHLLQVTLSSGKRLLLNEEYSTVSIVSSSPESAEMSPKSGLPRFSEVNTITFIVSTHLCVCVMC